MKNSTYDFLQSARESFLVLDSDLRVRTTNRSFNRSFDLTPEQSTGRLLSELGHGQWDIPALRELLENVLLHSGEFNDYKVVHELPGAGQRTMLLTGRRVEGSDSESNMILLSIEDVTKRLHAEVEASRRQRTWFETTLGCIGDAVIATDAETLVSFMNPTAEAMTGWKQREAVGQPLHEIFKIVNEDTRKLVESPVTKAIRLGAIVGLANHTVLIGRDGSERFIDDSAAPIRDEGDGKIIGVVMVFHDIGERRQAEQKLESSETRYRRLFEAAHDGILILDVESRRITEVNPFMLELLDYPRDHFIGKELWEIGIFHDKAANQKAMQALHEKGSIRFEGLPLQDRNGHRHAVEIVANVYLEGYAPVIQCNIRDISERVRFDQERTALLINEQALRMEAEGANRSKDLFLATLSHEVRTPLNAILGWATILRGKNCTAEDMHEGMEVIERNCKSQAQLIEDVLDVSRIVSGKLQLEIGPCELVHVIEAAMDVVRPAADAKGVRFETQLDPSASPASCDVNRIQQVVWNLLVNAVKFSAQGSVVRITLTRQKSTARIQVIDEGQGINAEFLPYVFDRFRQADSSTRRKHGGLGLGLSIVKHLVEMHGGTVHAESSGVRHGATFTVNLPVRAVHALDTNKPGAENIPVPDLRMVRLDGLRVLVVDDEIDARRLLLKVIGEAGAVVTAVGTVGEALTVLETFQAEVLLSDIALPDLDGYDLIRQVRASHSAKMLPAVALTAFAHKDDKLRTLLAGFQVHVAKPIDPHELIAVVASLTGRTGN